ncbi:Ribosomal protein L23 [Carabus blaptoides fortunei]
MFLLLFIVVLILPGRETGKYIIPNATHPDHSCDGGAFHLALVVHNDAGIVLEVNEYSVLPTERFPLPDHHRRHNLLPEFRFTLLHRGDDHVTRIGGLQSIQTARDTLYGNDIQILGTWWS